MYQELFFTKKYLIHIFFSQLFFTLCIFGEEPKIFKDKVFFPESKKTIFINPTKKLNNNSSKFDIQKPFIKEQKAIKINNWNLVFIITTRKSFEDKTIEINSYDFLGNSINNLHSKLGEPKIFFLEKTKIIFICNKSSHYNVRQSSIYDINLNLINTIKQYPSTIKCDKSNDDKLFWLISNHIKSKVPILKIKIFNFKGKLLEEKEYNNQSNIQFIFERKEYNISLPKIDFPG